MASGAQTATVLAADLMAGNEDPRGHAAQLLSRALAALPSAARTGRILLRADAGYFVGQLAAAAHLAQVEFAIGARRIAPLWRLVEGVADRDWVDAIDMDGAQVAVASYCPNWWPTATRLLIRRARLGVTTGHVSADPRARRRRTLRPDQRALPIVELAELNAVYGYSFIVTNRDVSTPDKAAAVEHWYRHRTQVENIRDAKLGAALRHLPEGYPQINRAWMWAALLAVSIAGWLHQLTATPGGDGQLLGHGVRDGLAMITTLRHRLIRVPARLIRHAGTLTLRLPPGYHLLETVLARLRPTGNVLTTPDNNPYPGTPPPEATLGPSTRLNPKTIPKQSNIIRQRSTHRLLADSGLTTPCGSHGTKVTSLATDSHR